ncbi:MAG: hypothetical protein OEV44_05620, partial [Spirochaetota bacterium]|nr:hypothetical protein [Spirochaetota bacterium]
MIFNKIKLVLFIAFTSSILYTGACSPKQYFGEFNEWKMPSENTHPEDIAVDPFNENIIWFTQPGINGIGKFDAKTQKITEFR